LFISKAQALTKDFNGAFFFFLKTLDPPPYGEPIELTFFDSFSDDEVVRGSFDSSSDDETVQGSFDGSFTSLESPNVAVGNVGASPRASRVVKSKRSFLPANSLNFSLIRCFF
jgi:hypothetical protein